MKAAAVAILKNLRERGHQAYLVGGCVRDLLLGREPADYDVATDATPEQVMRIFPRTWAVGAQFGVVLVPIGAGDLVVGSSGQPMSRSLDDRMTASDMAPEEVDKVASKAHAIEVATFRSDGLY